MLLQPECSASFTTQLTPPCFSLTGNQTETRSAFRGCSLTTPNSSQALTMTTASAHWKKSRHMGAWKENDARACLLSITMDPLRRGGEEERGGQCEGLEGEQCQGVLVQHHHGFTAQGRGGEGA